MMDNKETALHVLQTQQKVRIKQTYTKNLKLREETTAQQTNKILKNKFKVL